MCGGEHHVGDAELGEAPLLLGGLGESVGQERPSLDGQCGAQPGVSLVARPLRREFFTLSAGRTALRSTPWWARSRTVQ